MTRAIWTLAALTLVILWCCKPGPEFNPAEQLTSEQKEAVLAKIIRYVVRPPETASGEERFSSKYDEYYSQKLTDTRLHQYFEKNGEVYFLVSKPATDLKLKWHALGGKFKINGVGEVVEYEEIFRTWKMTPDALKPRSYFLFEKMIKEEPLEPYYTKNSNGVDLIELPDDRTYFDKAIGEWKHKE
jgi:hypothetical protein